MEDDSLMEAVETLWDDVTKTTNVYYRRYWFFGIWGIVYI